MKVASQYRVRVGSEGRGLNARRTPPIGCAVLTKRVDWSLLGLWCGSPVPWRMSMYSCDVVFLNTELA